MSTCLNRIIKNIVLAQSENDYNALFNSQNKIIPNKSMYVLLLFIIIYIIIILLFIYISI